MDQVHTSTSERRRIVIDVLAEEAIPIAAGIFFLLATATFIWRWTSTTMLAGPTPQIGTANSSYTPCHLPTLVSGTLA